MFTPSYQMYKYEHGLHVSAAEQRAADMRAGETAAALGELRLRLVRALRARPSHRARPRRETVANVVGASVRFMSSGR